MDIERFTKKKFWKKAVSMVLIVSMLMPNIAVFAQDAQMILPESAIAELRVSDSYAERHPNGVFEVVAPVIQTQAGEEFNFFVVRRGGTEGDVSINLKAVETVSKYGEDFVMSVPDENGVYTELVKEDDSSTLLEDYIEENEDTYITSDKILEDEDEETDLDEPEDESANSEEEYSPEEDAADEENPSEADAPDAQTDEDVSEEEYPPEDDAEKNENDTDKTEEALSLELQETEMTSGTSINISLEDNPSEGAGVTGEEPATGTDLENNGEDPMDGEENLDSESEDDEENLDKEPESGDPVDSGLPKTEEPIITQEPTETELTSGAAMKANYTSALHQLRDEATGEASLPNAQSGGMGDFFEIQDPEAIKASEDVTALSPGVSCTLDFADGEAYKIVKVKILESDVYKSQGTFSLTLYYAENGAELGDTMSSNIFIDPQGEAEPSVINFGETEITAFTDDDGVAVRLVRTGNLNDFVNVAITTLGDSAKADIHYLPVMGEAMFLPGESEKNIWIPLLTQDMGITEPLFLELKISTEDNAEIGADKARIDIYPAAADTAAGAGEDTALLRAYGAAGVPADAANEGIPARRDTGELTAMAAAVTADSKNTVELLVIHAPELYLGISTGNHSYRCTEVHKEDYTTAVDLTGIDSVDWRWEQSDASAYFADRVQSFFKLGDYTRKRNGKFDYVTETLTTADMTDRKLRKTNVAMELRSWTNWCNPSELRFEYVRGNLTNFHFTAQPAQALEYYTYTDASSVLPGSAVSFSPGSSSVSADYFNRDNVLSVNGVLSDDGRKYGAVMTGYKLTGNGNSVSIAAGGTQTADSSFISSYIYNGDQSKTALSGQAVYQRTEKVTSIKIADYDAAIGTLQIGGRVYDNQTIRSGKWLKGDKLRVTVTPNQGYHINKITVDGVDYAPGVEIPLSQGMTITPRFQRDDLTVSIDWKALGTGQKESKEVNMRHGSVIAVAPTPQQVSAMYADILTLPTKPWDWYKFFDADKQEQLQSAYIKKYGTNLKDYCSENKLNYDTHVESQFNSGSPDGTMFYGKWEGVWFPYLVLHWFPSFREYLDDGIPNGWKEEIQKGYNEYRQAQFANIREHPELFTGTEKLTNRSVGDVITVFAVTEPGYTCVWEYSDGKTNLKENEQMKRVLHVGDTFTFEVESTDAAVSYYFDKNNTSFAITKGRVVKSTSTLLKQSAFGVDINNPNTYTPVQGMSVTAGSTDLSQTAEVEGQIYRTYGETNENGEFAILAPNASYGMAASIALMNGDRLYPKHTVVKDYTPTIIFEVPFMDEKFKINGLTFAANTNSKVTIEDKLTRMDATTSPMPGYIVSKLTLRSYDRDGVLHKAWDMLCTAENVFLSEFNAQEYLQDDGRLTVEAYDIYGKGRGEVETGYSFYLPPTSGNMTMPSIAGLGGADLDVIGGVIPEMDLGKYEATPEEVETDGTGKETAFEIAVLTGEQIKNAMENEAKNGGTTFTEGSVTDRVNHLTTYIGVRDMNIVLADKEFAGKDSADAGSSGSGEGASAKTSGGKANLSVGLDFGFYMRISKVDGDYLFEELYGVLGVSVDAKKNFAFTIGPVPVYATLVGKVSAKGLIGIVAEEERPLLGGEGGWFNSGVVLPASDTEGVIGVFVHLGIGAGVGVRGALSVGVSGNMIMNIAWQPWEEGAGTVEFGLNVDIDLFIIPISFAVLSKKIKMFETPNYVDSGWVDLTGLSDSSAGGLRSRRTAAYEEINEDIKQARGEMGAVSRAYGAGGFVSEAAPAARLRSSGTAGEETATAKVLRDAAAQRGGLKHPNPQLIPLGGDSQLLLYVGDDSDRGDYDCAAIYYSISGGDGNWSAPVLLDDDGKYDSDFSVADIGNGRVMVVWGTADEIFGGTEPDMEEYLNSIYFKYCIFGADGTAGEIKTLVQPDEFSRSMPRISYDPASGRIAVAYAVTDYSDTRVDFGYETLDDLNSFMQNAYSTVAYKLLDTDGAEIGYGTGDETYLRYERSYGEGTLDNQRFAEINVSSSQEQLNINEMNMYTRDGRAFLLYTVDMDGNTDTVEDNELYASIIEYGTAQAAGPVRLTNNDMADSNPQVAMYDDAAWLFWNHGGSLVYSDFYSILSSVVHENSDAEDDYSAEYVDIPAGDAQPVMDVLEADNADAASTFVVTNQPDGNVYLLWNALEQFDDPGKDTPEDDMFGEESAGDYINKRSIYMRVYDPKYDTEDFTTEEGEPVYTGRWGQAVRVDEPPTNSGEGLYYNEQTISARSTDEVITAFRRYDIEDDGKESPNSDLVIHEYELVSTLAFEPESVYISPAHPMPGDTAVLNMSVRNVGVLPSEEVHFSATMDGGSIGETSVTSHLSTDGSVSGQLSFEMPADSESVTFDITAWEDNLSGSAATHSYTVESAPEIDISNVFVDRVDNESAVVTAVVTNTGNKDTGAVTFTAAKMGDVMGDVLDETKTEMEYSEFYSGAMENIAVGESVEVVNEIDISEAWGDEEQFQLTLMVGSGANGEYQGLGNEDVMLNKFRTEDISISDITLGWDAGAQTQISVYEAETVYPEAGIYPKGAAGNYTLEYEIANPDIASVDASSGGVTGLAAGKTTLTVRAVSDNYRIFVDRDDVMRLEDGTVVQFDADGQAINLPADGERFTAFTKTFDVVISSVAGTDPDTPSKPGSSGNGGSGGGSSGGGTPIAAAEPGDTAADTGDGTESAAASSKAPAKVKEYSEGIFTDITGHWAEQYIADLYERGLASGRGANQFAPAANLTRAEFVMLLFNMSGDSGKYFEPKRAFDDVFAGSWYDRAVAWAFENGVTSGIGNNMFGPDNPITRQDAFVMLYRFINDNNIQLADGAEKTFTDSGEIASYALEAVSSLARKGVIGGYPDGSLMPKASITRAEMAAMLYSVIRRWENE